MLSDKNMNEGHIYSIIVGIASGLSMLGCSFVIVAYLSLKELQVFSFKLVVYLCIVGFGHSIGILYLAFLIPNSYSQTLCDIQASVIIYTTLSSILWTVSIVHSLYRIIVKQDNHIQNSHLKYHFLSYISPALIVATVNIFGSIEDYNSNNQWCWISNNGLWKDSILRGISLYVPLWILILYSIFVYYKIILTIKQAEEYMTQEVYVKNQLVRRLRLYPCVLILCYSLTSAYRFMQLLDLEVSSDFFLRFLAALFSTLAGFLHSIMYGLNPLVRNALCKYWKGSKVIKYELMETVAEFSLLSEVY